MSSAICLPLGLQEKERMNLSLNSGPSQCINTKTMAMGCAKHLLKCKDCASIRTVGPKDLVARLHKNTTSRTLVLDCRPFIAYNLNHIAGALNISCCDRFTKRKLERGKASVGDLVSGQEDAKALFKEYLSGSDVILYDDSTTDVKALTATSPLSLVLSSLLKEGKEAFILEGGIQEFQSHFSELCAKTATEDSGPLYSPTTPLICSDIATATASQILPFLYLGNERDSHSESRLKELGITHILNCTAHIPFHFPDQAIVYKRLPATDCSQQNLAQYFKDAFEFIDNVKQENGKVLIHCQAGVSRSATITIAYIMYHSKLSMLEAYKYVKSKRSIIAPNFNFMGQLLEFEKQINEGIISRCLEHQLSLESKV